MQLTPSEIEFIKVAILNGQDFVSITIKFLAEKHQCSETEVLYAFVAATE